MFLVIELQTTNGATASIVNQYETQALAEQQYYFILSAASVSNIDVHSAILMDCRGVVLKNDFYDRRGLE